MILNEVKGIGLHKPTKDDLNIDEYLEVINISSENIEALLNDELLLCADTIGIYAVFLRISQPSPNRPDE